MQAKIRKLDNSSQDNSVTFLNIEYRLSSKLTELQFNHPVKYVYNPLEYARDLHEKFIKKYYNTSADILFVGMNPGPWGMCQTGIPFSDSTIVKEQFHIEGVVNHPEREHPKKIVDGLDCKRSERSGTKFWGLICKICGRPENFFKHCLLYNICPLAFVTDDGKNFTPADMKKHDLDLFMPYCSESLINIVNQIKITTIIGIGQFASKKAAAALKSHKIEGVKVTSIPHPSPRNPKSSANWEKETIEKLKEVGIYERLTSNVT